MTSDAALWLLASLALYILAGGTLFGILLNRFLLDGIRSSHGKLPIMLSILAGILAVACAAAVPSAGNAGMLVPAAFLAGVGVWECRRLAFRRRMRGAPPVETLGPHPSLLRPFTTHDLVYKRYVVQDLPGVPRPFRAVFVSDTHCYDGMPRSYYQHMVDRIRAAEADLVLLGGDFVKNETFAPMLTDIFQHVRGRLGTFCAMGNHDHWSDAAAITRALVDAGIHPLGNGWQRVALGSGSLLVSGCEEPWSPDLWQEPPRDGTLTLVISHTADNIFRLSKAGVGAVFSGHYHGGHFSLPVYGPVVIPSRYGRLFDKGHFRVGPSHLFVSTGAGTVTPSFRFYSQPEVLAVDFR